MVLQRRSQSHLIEVVIIVNGLAEILIVLILNVNLVDGLVHISNVNILHILQVIHSQSHVACLLELTHHTSMIQRILDSGQETLKEHRMLSNHEVNSTVVQLLVVHLTNHIEEVLLFEGNRAVINHRTHSHIVVLSLLI